MAGTSTTKASIHFLTQNLGLNLSTKRPSLAGVRFIIKLFEAIKQINNNVNEFQAQIKYFLISHSRFPINEFVSLGRWVD